MSRRRQVTCPACGCDVADLCRNEVALRLQHRVNRAQVTRVARLLEDAERHFVADRKRQSYGDVYKADIRAVRYVFNRLMAELTAGAAAPQETP